MQYESNIPKELIEKTALRIYRRRIKRGIPGTPSDDWESAKLRLKKQPRRISWWLLINKPYLKPITSLFWLITALINFVLRALWSLSFPFRLPFKLWNLADNKKFWQGFSDEKEREYNLEVVKAVLSGLGLIATIIAGVGLIATYRDNIEDRKLAQERLVTDRWAKSITLLDSEDETVRVGSIYSLERIKKDSPKDHWSTVEILSSYIRKYSPVPEEGNSKPISIDVQAALTVLARRERDIVEPDRLNLSSTNLSGANLSGAYLSDAYLVGADLSDAILSDADLSGAYLVRAELGFAILSDADLSDAKLWNANLDEAELWGANLSDANLSDANLSGVILIDAILSDANLSDANLSDAELSRAKLSGANLSGANLSGAYLVGADLSDADLSGAYLSGAFYCYTTMPNGEIRNDHCF